MQNDRRWNRQSEPLTPEIIHLLRLHPSHLFRWLGAVIFDWSVVVLTFVLALKVDRWFGYVATLFIIGNRQHAIGILGHDAAHYSVSRSHRLNDFLGNLFCFWPITASIKGYREFHFKHHRYNGTKLDPELEHKKEFPPDWDLPARPSKLAVLVLKDLMGLGWREVLKAISFFKPVDFIDAIGPAVILSTALFLLIKHHHIEVFILWQLALFTTMWATFRVRIWTEHFGTQGTHRLWLSWWQRWLIAPHNTWYHWEHHKYPSVAYPDLPKIRTLDHSESIINLQQLFKYLEEISKIESGKPLREDLSDQPYQPHPSSLRPAA